MTGAVIRLIRRTIALLFGILVVFLVLRAIDSQRGPALESWHTVVPDELKAADLDQTDWAGYLAAEERVFEQVRREVSLKLPPDERVPTNRYFEASRVYPGRRAQDWNRSIILEPADAPLGAVVLLHGLTDAPFSLRHVAQLYRDRGFVALLIRLPGHGSVPAGLTDITFADWLAATRLAMREARRRVGPGRPLHLVGYSNGGALAVSAALDAIADESQPRADRIVLLSPMIGVTRFARFAGLAGLPALFPAFAKAAWLDRLPEFNPFKYNSFPVNAARQSYLLTHALQTRLARAASDNRLGRLPPILTFQSVVDFTVSARAVVNALYARLPANGSELVLFDLNRNAAFEGLLSPATETVLDRLTPAAPRAFRLTVVTNAGEGRAAVVARTTEAGGIDEQSRELSLSFPPGVYSLSHIALPFPVRDGLYGLDPDPQDDFGIHLGALAARGERGTLVMSLDALLRMSSNPFFPFLQERVLEGIKP
jgi:alpha-beta hydrolase superfamily lysophospholipase